ncbi:MAG: hypothetical protein M3Y87_06370 [Myxococcota bacterium]|nr:hypothetical protein [Myxococcota bacterium]
MDLVAEHCAVHVVERTERAIVFVALHHEDVHDPGDAWLTYVRATREHDGISACVVDDLDRIDIDAFCTDFVPASR